MSLFHCRAVVCCVCFCVCGARGLDCAMAFSDREDVHLFMLIDPDSPSNPTLTPTLNRMLVGR